ncbi:hypothetical protein H2200_004738 [Cladophialophora chaetospira]|uniref:Mediator of RNA polymerase II transcription subunit 9 n=1 Tax=Cladophialophora chaetospira TaxID=386627 RepID=A0AA39CKQ9_9EURO|nr:hypothetical protein H2200_004738 [Cladophialophora chaetospira]
MPSAVPFTHPDVPPFPPPSTFSLLPDIYILLARLHLLHQTSQSQTNGHSQQSTQPHPQINPAILNGAPLLDPKDLPGQIYPLKQKLAKARAAVEELPDVDRTVEEQEDEIRRLESRVRGLKTRLASLGEIAREKGDVEMREAGEQGG